jgi:hypothetical protein
MPSLWRETALHHRRPSRHEKKSRDLSGKAEDEKPTSVVQFLERPKAVSSSDEFFGIEESELSTNEPADQPKLELLPPEKILLGFAFVVTATLLVVLLLLLITWPA